jgi:hypothetical protein
VAATLRGLARAARRRWLLARRSSCAQPATGQTPPTLPSTLRLRAVLHRIAADMDELARARRVADLNTAATLPDRSAELRRRVAEPDLDFNPSRPR